MSDQLGEDVPSETAQAWDSARRVREPIAWMLLVLTAIGVLISAWELFGLPGTPVITGPSPVPITGPSPVPVATFGLRASVVAPQFVSLGFVALPVLSVIPWERLASPCGPAALRVAASSASVALST